LRSGRTGHRGRDRGNLGKLIRALEWHGKFGPQLDGWNRRFERGDQDIPAYFYERPELDAISKYYLAAWCDLATERPVIATQAGVSEGVIPRSKIKSYAEDDLGLNDEEVEFFIAVIRQVDIKSRSKTMTANPELSDQVAGGDAVGVKTILGRLAKKEREVPTPKQPRVRHPRP
jgi:hypothetical protein